MDGAHASGPGRSTVPGELPELVLGGQAWKVVPADALVAAWGASGAEQVVAQRLRVQLQVREGQAPAAESVPLRMTHAGERGQGSVGGLADALAFPLASPPAEGEALWLPVAELVGFEPQLAPYPSALLPLERDGLADFSWSLFAEPSLAAHSSDVLADRAEALRYARPHSARAARHARAVRQRRPRADGRVHAAGRARCGPAGRRCRMWSPGPNWIRSRSRRPRWRRASSIAVPNRCAGLPAWCRSGPGRHLHAVLDRGHSGATYRLEEASDAAFATATSARGTGRRFAVAGKRSGAFHYRVRATLGARRGWSAPVRIELGRPGFQTRPWQSQDLLSIHRLMLRCAAGRGDVLAVLAARALRPQAGGSACAGPARLPSARGPELPPVIGADEGRALSHGALYHPGW